jgi:hypothetical protein
MNINEALQQLTHMSNFFKEEASYFSSTEIDETIKLINELEKELSSVNISRIILNPNPVDSQDKVNSDTPIKQVCPSCKGLGFINE